MAIFKWSVVTVVKGLVLALIAGVIFLFMSAGAGAGECPSWACPSSTGAVTRNIVVPSSTGIGSRIIGDLYTPYPGARTQIRERSSTGIGSRIRAYIESDGRITDPDTRQEIGRIDRLLGR